MFYLCSSPYIASEEPSVDGNLLKSDKLNTIPRKTSLILSNESFIRSKQVFKSDNLIKSAPTISEGSINQITNFSVCIPKSNVRSQNIFSPNFKETLSFSRNNKSEDNILNDFKCISLSENSLTPSKCSSIRDTYSSHDSDSIDFFKSKENDVSQFEYSSKSESDISSHRTNNLADDQLLKVK